MLDTPRGDEVGFRIEVDARAHSAAVVARTCYALAEFATFIIETGATHLVTVRPAPELSCADVEDRFHRELIDFTVRADIEEKTSGIRDLIWRTAFAEASPRDG